MRGIEFYDRILDLPGPSTIPRLLYAGIFLVVAAVVVLSLGRVRWVARGMGIVGVLCFMLALFLIHEEKFVEVKSDQVRITRWRYSPTVRFQVRVALIALPAAGAFLMAQIYWESKRRERSKVPAHLKEGRIRLHRGDPQGALAEFDQALRISPYLGDAYFNRAAVYQALGRNDEALADLDQALRCDPQIAGAYLARGRLLANRGSLEAADVDLDRYLGMRPGDVEGYLHRGLCRARQGRDVEAVSDLQRVVKMTNHSDYAEPAQAALQALYAKVPDAEETEALPPPAAPIRSILEGIPRYGDEHAARPLAAPGGGPDPDDALPPR